LDKQFGRACLHGRAIYFSEETQTLRIGSSGRTRTYNPPVNSHTATALTIFAHLG